MKVLLRVSLVEFLCELGGRTADELPVEDAGARRSLGQLGARLVGVTRDRPEDRHVVMQRVAVTTLDARVEAPECLAVAPLGRWRRKAYERALAVLPVPG